MSVRVAWEPTFHAPRARPSGVNYAVHNMGFRSYDNNEDLDHSSSHRLT